MWHFWCLFMNTTWLCNTLPMVTVFLYAEICYWWGSIQQFIIRCQEISLVSSQVGHINATESILKWMLSRAQRGTDWFQSSRMNYIMQHTWAIQFSQNTVSSQMKLKFQNIRITKYLKKHRKDPLQFKSLYQQSPH